MNNPRESSCLLLLLVTLASSLLLQTQAVQADSLSSNKISNNATREHLHSPHDTLRRVSSDDIKIGVSIAAVLTTFSGALLCFVGYRLLRPPLFVCGFALAGVVGSIVVETLFKHHSWVHTASWITFEVSGAVGGFLVISLYSVGVFVAGALGGVLLACHINASAGPYWYAHHMDLVLVVLSVVLGLVCGALAYVLERPMLIVVTSYCGAYLSVAGVGYSVGNFPSSASLNQYYREHPGRRWNDDDDDDDFPTAWLWYMNAVGVLFVVGMLVQFLLTARHVSHTSSSKDVVLTPKERCQFELV